jgi:uncharacterized membrane protein HdeD (DUF308 family)
MPAVAEDTGRVAPKAPPARLWWILAARAVVAFLLGVLVLLSQKTRPVLGNFIGVYWLVGSLLTLRWVQRHRRQPGNRLVWAAAILGVVAGLLVLLRFALEDVLSTSLVLTLLGLTAILTGLLRLSGTFRDHVIDGRPRLPHRVALGILELGLGVLLVLAHRATRPVAIAAGLWAIVGGTIMLVDALALRRMGRMFGQAEG